jgi:ABC-type nitrate/sulfonate/bicarbonate transport system substrate-binding protein
MTRLTLVAARLAVACVAVATFAVAAYAQSVPTIRFGRQTAGEDNLWLMIARPDLAPHLGKDYKVSWTQLRGADIAFKAIEAGQVDMISTQSDASLAAAASGLNIKIIASVTRENVEGPHTYWLAKKDGGPKTIHDLKGKTIGILGYRTGIELWARAALLKNGMNPDTDVHWAVVPFAAAADAVRSGRVAAAAAPEPFAEAAFAKGDLKPLFTSKTGEPFDTDLIVIDANPDFLKAHPAAVKAFLSDLKAVTNYFVNHLQEARQDLLKAKLVAMPPKIYLNLKEYPRDPKLMPNIEGMKKQVDVLLKAGFIDKKIDVDKVVDLSYQPQ